MTTKNELSITSILAGITVVLAIVFGLPYFLRSVQMRTESNASALAHEIGVGSRHAGIEPNANPYKATHERVAWLEGWIEGNSEED